MPMLYHATSEAAAQSILASGRMVPGKGGFCGSAIYFSDSIGAARRKSRHGSQVVLEVDVDLGRMKTISHRSEFKAAEVRREGYDSVCLEGGNDDVYAVYDSNRIKGIRRMDDSEIKDEPQYFNDYYGYYGYDSDFDFDYHSD